MSGRAAEPVLSVPAVMIGKALPSLRWHRRVQFGCHCCRLADQTVTAPPQVWFLKVARAWILSGPGRLAMTFRIVNEPLGPRSRGVRETTTAPLSVIRTLHTWPARSWWPQGRTSGVLRRLIIGCTPAGAQGDRGGTRREDPPPLLADLDCAVRGSGPFLRVCLGPVSESVDPATGVTRHGPRSLPGRTFGRAGRQAGRRNSSALGRRSRSWRSFGPAPR
jgi:hypothetical protein